MADEAKPFVCGEEEYAAKGKPMFGKTWTYEELLSIDRPRRTKDKKQPPPKPANWPHDTEVDVSKWVFWLPEGWIQGLRTSPAGKTLKCYFTPEGRRFWHKKDIEKLLGRELPKLEPPPKVEDEEGNKIARVKYVTDSDAIPHWPEEDWLPKDFRILYRQLPSGLHTIYVPPGQDDGFLYHRHLVMDYVDGKVERLSPFGTSKFQADIAAKNVEDASTKRKVKRHRSDGASEARVEDYEECGGLSVVALPAPTELSAKALTERLRQSGDSRPEELLKNAEDVRAVLVSCGFAARMELLAVLRTTVHSCDADGAGRPAGSEGPRLLDTITGVYYRTVALHGDRPCYQSTFVHPATGRLVCRGFYIFWSQPSSRWQIGGLSDLKAGIAFTQEACSSPLEISRPWRLLREANDSRNAAEGARNSATVVVE